MPAGFSFSRRGVPERIGSMVALDVRSSRAGFRVGGWKPDERVRSWRRPTRRDVQGLRRRVHGEFTARRVELPRQGTAEQNVLQGIELAERLGRCDYFVISRSPVQVRLSAPSFPAGSSPPLPALSFSVPRPDHEEPRRPSRDAGRGTGPFLQTLYVTAATVTPEPQARRRALLPGSSAPSARARWSARKTEVVSVSGRVAV